MDPQRFDAVIRAWSSSPTRRAALRVLAGSAVAALAGRLDLVDSTAKKKKRKKKKVKLCRDGRTIKVPKRKKKKIRKLRRGGATSGACRACQPACDGQLCGSDDGCGGICGCGAGSVCQAGLCHACTVTCNGGGTACGNDLKTALTGTPAGGTVFVCPGRYVGNFTLGSGALIGAGDGDDPATSTILDANKNGQVVRVPNQANVALYGLRITGGSGAVSDDGAGVENRGTLAMTACTVDENHSERRGGGIASLEGDLTLTACVVSGNSALEGGGIELFSDSLTINGSAITGNKANHGGGLSCMGTVTFDSASSVTGNVATTNGGGISRMSGTVALNGATVSGNTPNNCVNVPGCVG